MRGLIIFLFLAYSPVLLAADVKTAGFVQGLWYDRAEIFAEETVRLYVAIRNNTGSDLTGRVEFKDNGKVIGSASASALNNRIIESWVDWNPTYGDHTITATLSRVELSAVGTSTRRVEVVESATEEKFFVDYDIDKDKVGNQTDTDDDGDGLKDTDDSEPLKFNEGSNYNDEEEELEEENTDEDNDDDEQEDDDEESEDSGLEKFLNDNRADSVLSGVTNLVTNAKTNLDEYRERRNAVAESEAAEEAASESVENTANQSSIEANIEAVEEPYSSFGEVSRTKSDDGGWIGKIWGVIKDFISSVYTFILFIISVYLGHPAVVQLTLLFLIVFIVFKLAKRMSSRPY